MRQRGLVPIFLAGMFCCTGCGPSTNDLQKMRLEQDTQQTTNNNVISLLDSFQAPNDAIWRAEAMTTMVWMDNHLVPSKGRDLHEDIISALKAEYDEPKIKSRRSEHDDEYRLRAWAVYSLGRIDDDRLNEYFINILCSNNAASDNAFLVRLAALDSLVSRIDQVIPRSDLRPPLLCQLTLIRHQLNQNGTCEEVSAAISAFCDYFESRLTNYADIVQILASATETNLVEESLLGILTMDYQCLQSGDHKTSQGQALFASNMDALVELSWHPSKRIRDRARVILSEFAPDSLLVACAEAIQSRKLVLQDSLLLVNLLPIADRSVGYSPDTPADVHCQYAEVRNKSLDALLTNINDLATEQREIVYARLIEYAPQWLLRHLFVTEPEALNDVPAISQHLRYLNHFRVSNQIIDAQQRSQIVACMAQFVSKHEQITPEVAAYLLQDEPLSLALACVKPIRESQDYPADPGQLLSIYIACLEQIERHIASQLSPQMLEEFNTHPYQLLAHAIKMDNTNIRQAAVAFLRTRDANILVDSLADLVLQSLRSGSPLSLSDFRMLGDTLQESRDVIMPKVYKVATEALRLGLEADEEVSLACARYLLELGEKIPIDAQKFPAIRQLVIVANQTLSTNLHGEANP